ncbi:hypothetical protein EDD21DRAFT_368710 [Dissophora ornata]|nr:hypothetical protein EDD21DRAFT_368710 [Dissophora ornata]
MFASTGLFTVIPCLCLPDCPSEPFNIFSLPPTEATSFTTSSTNAAASTRKVKRKLGDITREDDESQEPAQSYFRKTDKHHQNTGGIQPMVQRHWTPISAMEAAKARRKALNINAPITISTSLARPPALLCLSMRATILATAPASSVPPSLKIDLRAHSKPAVATQYYNEFLRIYNPLADTGSNLASSHAVDQEKAVHSKTNQGSYRSLASSVLQRLKKRPLAISEEDVGIDGEWLDPQLKAKENLALDDIWRGASKYVQTLEELEANGYPIEIPKGSPPPLEETQILYLLYFTLFAFSGEKIKQFPCCDAPQGSRGCHEGTHVFKEDDHLSLHGRTPFLETPKTSSSGGQRHAVIATDCEMGYTTGGFELIRLTFVDKAGTPIMDELVKPSHNVLDLNSRFSGIVSLEGAKFTLDQARKRLLQLIDKDTIIIDQSLENDFKVLRLIHTRVIDTAMLYPHPQRFQNFRYSLQRLAREHLQIRIQDSEEGHDSYEDAKTCLDLVRLKITKDVPK